MPSEKLFQPRIVRGHGADGPNVLIVDDIDANLVALEAVLSSLQCRLVYARSGSEALAHLLREEFALILLDVQMPGMDGYETARLVRARQKTQHVPIIFLTAHDHDSIAIKRAYDLGAVDFLSKPLDVDVLRAKAQAFIALYERTLEVAELRAEFVLREERARQEGEGLRRDMERLAAADRRKTALLSAVARELQSPFASLRSAIDRTRAHTMDADTSALLAAADKELVHAKRTLDALSDVTRVSMGEFHLELECVDLAVLVDRAVAEVRPAAEAYGHRVVLEPPRDAIAVEVDAGQMVRVIGKLLANAARHTPRGGTITVAWRVEYGHAVLCIEDDGIGIEPSALDGLFDLFAPERPNGARTRGLGLGLTLAKQVVELHRGRILARSAGIGCGTTFEIRLIAAEFPVAAARNRVAAARQHAHVRPRVLRILVVDSDVDACRVTAALLAGRGHHVLVAHDAREALVLLCDSRPDVAFVALQLSVLDGCEVVRLARTIEPPLSTRFVGMAAATDEHPTATRFDCVVKKPIASSAVVAIEAE